MITASTVRMSRWPLKFLLGLALVFLSACTTLKPPVLSAPFDNNYQPIATYLSAYINKEMKQGGLTGLSIALVDQNAVAWSKGFGFANKEQSIKATEDTRYRAGSVSKVFNAVAIMQLVEQGVLELDVPVVQYLPEFSINSRFGATDDITLRTLLSHQSGLPSDNINGMWDQDQKPLLTVLDALRESHVVSPANTHFSYSNVGVSLSGLVLQAVTEESYVPYLEEQILAPLQMTQSDFSGRLRGDAAAAAYMSGKSIEELPLRDTPAGGLNTTVLDLAKFLFMVNRQGTPLLQQDSFKHMVEVQNPDRTIDMGQRVGLGWLYEPQPLTEEHEIIWHGGRTVAHTARISSVPELGLGVAILTNSADNTDALSRIASEALQLMAQTRGLATDKMDIDAIAALDLHNTPNLQGDFAGPLGWLSVKPDGKRFSAQAMNLSVSLRPEEDGWFSPRIMLWVIPLRPKDLKTVKVTQAPVDGINRLIGQYQGMPFLLGDEIEPYDSSPEWDKHLGQYKVRDPVAIDWMRSKDTHLKRAKDFYYLEVTTSDGTVVKLPIRPLNDQQFIVLGTGRSLGDTGRLIEAADTTQSSFKLYGQVYDRQ